MKESTTHRRLVFAGLLLAMFMAAIEATIVATAMPSIAAELGGFSLYSWVFSSFLLMQAVTIPIFGKVSDLLGRKPVFVAGVIIFLIGSVLCGFAHTMRTLICFRFIQGLGAGAVQPITTTLAGDLYTLEERGRIQGYMSGVWGVSSIIGPLVGGLIVHSVGWPWIFWVNLPIGVAAIALVVINLHEDVERPSKPAIDYAGAILILIGVAALMLALTQSGTWDAALLIGLVLASLAAFVLFIKVEKRAVDPLMALSLWRDGLIRYANLAGLTSGILMIGIITFLPTYVQGVLGGSAMLAGFTLSVMTVGWPIAGFTAGSRIARVGVRRFVRAGGFALVIGALIIALLSSTGPLAAGVGSFVVGIGLGLVNTTTLVAIQASVSWRQRGVATAMNMLMRILGQALGAALFGGVLNWQMTRWLQKQGLARTVSLDSIQDLLGGEAPPGRIHLAGETMRIMRDGLSRSLHTVFWAIALLAVITLVLAFLIPELRRGADVSDAVGASAGH
jgi:EmrB/QacA subfamily drug resistance transporter